MKPLLLAGLAFCATGCAWSNPANRPLWNTFEANLVPDDQTARVASLPLTVPVGLVAIAADTLIAHPVQAVGDAWGDAGDLWRDLEWQEHYYTEMGFLPVRAVGSPVVFLGSWLGRSLFDVPRRPTEAEAAARAAAAAARGTARDEAAAAAEVAARRAGWRTLCAALAEHGEAAVALPAEPTWNAELQAAFARALARADAHGRQRLLSTARTAAVPPLVTEPWLGLRDRDPVIRYRELRSLPPAVDVPADLQQALRDDPSETIREMAVRRFGVAR